MNTLSTATLLHQTFQCLIEQLVADLHEAGYRDIRSAHSRVFEHLPAKGARVAQMAEAAQMTQQSMTELVEYLELLGYVERLPDPRDRRANVVRLTKTGERLSGTGRAAMRRIDASWEARLGKDRMREMRSALSDVLEFYGRRRGPKARKPDAGSAQRGSREVVVDPAMELNRMSRGFK